MMKKTEPEKTEREARMRAAIKKAAFTLMAEKGLDKVSMREIAEKVNVTKPVLYYYFKNKEDLCYSLIEEHETAFGKRLQETNAQGLGPEALLRQILLSHLDFFSQDPIHSKFVLQMIAYTLDAKNIRPPAKHKNAHDLLADALAREEQKGRLPKGSFLDVMMLVDALSADLMFSAYFHQHVWADKEHHCPRRNSCMYGPEDVERLIKIILLGVNAYYQNGK